MRLERYRKLFAFYGPLTSDLCLNVSGWTQRVRDMLSGFIFLTFVTSVKRRIKS